MRHDDEGIGSILKGFFLLGLFAYILPVLMVASVLIGVGVGIGWLLWGH